MAAIMSPEAVVADQQKYAIEKDIPGIFEALTMTLVVNKPEEPLTFISSEASRLAAANSLELPEPGRQKDTELGAQKYLEDHRIQDILEELFTSVLFSKPAEPLTFLAEESARLKAQKDARKPSNLYTLDDLKAMHSLYDPSGKGTISRAQLATAYRNLGLKQTPATSSEGIDAESFVKLVTAALAEEKVL